MKIFCKHHTVQIDTEFFNNYRRCPAHVKYYRNIVKISLREITLEKLELYCIPNFGAKKLILAKEDKENVENGHEIHKTNEITKSDKISKKQQRILQINPQKCSSALSLKYYDQIENYHLLKKIKEITTKFKKVVPIALSEPQLLENCSNYQRLVDSVKKKIKNCSNGRKTTMLTLVPKRWTIKKIRHFYKVSKHALSQARKLKKERILATPGSYSRERLRKETEKLVLKFY